jgi:serine/threonine-protein kinase
MIGEVIGSYRVVAELGKGGMGVVYRAEHVQLGRPAALKMLLPQLSSDASIVQRFFNEARAASAIDHPGIVEIYDFGTHRDGRAYIAMALLRGETLEHRLRRGPLAPGDGATIVAQAVAALAAAHARGIVHRDLKPDNLFLEPNDLMPGGLQVKLLDFGIAKLADEPTAGLKTQTGALMGTPAYMSPEQCMGRADLDHRTDIYAVGCILFHALCGRPPFVSTQGTGMMIAAHIRDAAPDPRTLSPQLPAALAAIVLRCLEKEPGARFQTATELRNALVAAGANAPLSRPPGAEAYGATLAAPGAASAPAVPFAPGSGAGAGYPPSGHPASGPGFGLPPSVHPASGGAATTRGEAAAQIMAPPATSRSRVGLVVGGALLALIGAGVAIAVTRGGGDRTGAVIGAAGQTGGSGAAGASTAGSGAPPTADDRAGGGSAAPTNDRAGSGSAAATDDRAGGSAAPTRDEHAGATPPSGETAGSGAPLAQLPDCPPGQARRDDTRGHCCWPGQAWSISGKKCVGAPSCPDGMAARRDRCVPVEEPRRPDRQPALQIAAPSFRLGATSYAPGDSIEIQFIEPVRSTPQSRAWITVIEADRPPSAYGAWEYLADGATLARLKAPDKPGAYQVRLHTDYPAKSFNVQGAVAVTVSARAEAEPGSEPTPRGLQRFQLARGAVAPGAMIDIAFATALRAAPREQFWITVVAAGAADNAWGTYEYVPAGARRMQLAAPAKPGDYEVRLHANYPTRTTNLVHRAAIRVED